MYRKCFDYVGMECLYGCLLSYSGGFGKEKIWGVEFWRNVFNVLLNSIDNLVRFFVRFYYICIIRKVFMIWMILYLREYDVIVILVLNWFCGLVKEYIDSLSFRLKRSRDCVRG